MEISLTMMLSAITFILTFSSVLETTQSRMFRQPNVLLSSGREHDAVYRPSPSPPPPPRPATPSRPSAQYSLPWSFPLSASYYVNKLESFIFPLNIIGSNNWYGSDSPKYPPPPTANTPGRQIDGDQYVAATGGYRRTASVGPPPPPYPPAVIGLTFSRTSLHEPQLDESS
nr:uncharacterized protein LOC109155293 [Ipomoea trifida]GMC68969.1 uncharacterized protein LOC109155293 [Ipomoea batatas]